MRTKPLNDLTAEQVRGLLHYNPDTGLLTWEVRVSQRAKPGMVAGGLNAAGYCKIQLFGRKYAAHRLAWLIVHGVWPPNDIDHKDNNRSDNRIEQLRPATYKQNSHNKHTQQNNKLGIKGVCKIRGNKFRAQITIDGRVRHLGIFKTAEQAHDVYNEVAEEVYGDFHKS